MPTSEGRPIVRRFVIRRHAVNVSTGHPWAMRDRSRPAWLGQYPTHAAAIAAIDRRLSEETGIPTRREIRAAMAGSEPTA